MNLVIYLNKRDENMQSILQKLGLTFLVLSISGVANIAPATAGITDGYEGVNSEASVEELTGEVNSEIGSEDSTSEVIPELDSIPESTLTEEGDTLGSEDISATNDTILEVASSSDTFTTLVSALSETELMDVLQGDGPFTVFAPTNEAFEALPEGTVESLMAPENKEILVSLLSYHVVAANLPSEQLETGSVTSVQGTPLNVEVGEEVTVNGVTVIDNDIAASNGVIHVVDEVILPPQ